VQYIAEAGFDHIRLPVDEQQLWDSTGKRNDDAFQLLDNLMNWANKAGLRVVLDLHILRSHHFNEAEKTIVDKARSAG
jgi:endoglucanase